MGLNISKGNMYEFITHTYNIIKGRCYHDCSYCYMKKFGKLPPPRFDKKELETDLGENNYIFVGSSIDMWADNIPAEWITDTLKYCHKFDNNYLFQTKNPANLWRFEEFLPSHSKICVTIESNRHYPKHMHNSPIPANRVISLSQLKWKHDIMVTIEPIMNFDLIKMVSFVEMCKPIQVNIGADSCCNNLPEPNKDSILELIYRLEKFTTIIKKKNLNRLIN